MFSLPGILRYVLPHQVQRDQLTGSQRQRGMYMNAGKDAMCCPEVTILMGIKHSFGRI